MRLVDAYRSGAGHTTPSKVTASYPGWLFADSETGAVTASQVITSTRARTLAVDLVQVRHTHEITLADGRPRQLDSELVPLYDAVQDPGSVLIVCNTVPDAQQTYLALTGRRGNRAPRVLLLHARMPVWQREEITNTLLELFGPKSPRPKEPLIVVTTQIAEQSLAVDFDLVISDLAPLAQLLQRAGRGHRHSLGTRGTRPSWASKPRLVVLVPTGELPPPARGEVYDAALLRRTRDRLLTLQNSPIEIPNDVAGMIDNVYTELNDLADRTLPDDHERARRNAGHAAAADAAAIPAPGNVTDLYPMTDREIDPATLTTRLGADSERILPIYISPDGKRWIGTGCTEPLPMPSPGRNQLDRDTVACLIRLTVQAPSRYLPHDDPETHTPREWAKTPAASELRLLPHPVSGVGTPGVYSNGRHALRLDPQLGLVRQRAGQ